MIKKTICLLIFIILTTNLSYSQVFCGFKAGLGISSVKYEMQEKEKLMKPHKKLKPGIFAGLILNLELNKVLEINSEIIYIQKGLKYKQETIGDGKKIMNYIEIPILGKYNFKFDKKKQFSAFIGAYEAYWLSGKEIYKKYSTGETTNTKVDFNNTDFKYNRFDTGIILGLDYTIRNKKNQQIFEIRYEHGMLSSSQENADALLNRIFTISYSYLFRL